LEKLARDWLEVVYVRRALRNLCVTDLHRRVFCQNLRWTKRLWLDPVGLVRSV
jgi:hypothetical protein